jgi:hypothetical protein
MDTDFFGQIKNNCPKQKIVGLSNKLAKRCSFNSKSDMEALCHLAYWLYVYGETDNVLRIADATHGIEFNGDWDNWTFIEAIWGLEIRILVDRDKAAEADNRISEIDRRHSIQTGVFDTPEKMSKFETKRRARMLFANETCQDKIDERSKNGDIDGANEWRLVSLLKLIGSGATGLYPDFEQHKADMELAIKERIAALKDSR